MLDQAMQKPQDIEAVGKGAMVARSAVRPGRGGVKTQVSILELVGWAFQREKASLDFHCVSGPRASVGMEYIMMQRAMLGCRVEGGGRSERHHDADIVASALAVLPERVGGRAMAILIVEHAREGRLPVWDVKQEPRCLPVEWKQSKHGTYAAREFCREVGQRWPLSQLGRDDGYWCPVWYTATGADRARARRGWLRWWGAMLELRDTFRIYGGLTAFEVTESMPRRCPWEKSS